MLLSELYDELRALAARKLSRESPGHTLCATALVHEAWLRVDADGDHCKWESKAHFWAAAAEAMRRILVESARRKARLKRGNNVRPEELVDSQIAAPEPRLDVLALDEALSRLSEQDPEIAELVKLRYFAGFTMSEIAEQKGIAPRSLDRMWSFARAWLKREMANSR